MSHRLERTQIVPRPREEVFRFFSDTANLRRLTPPAVGFRILSAEPVAIVPGALIDYEVRLYGVPFRWRTRIEEVEPGRWFSDSQVVGPYRTWLHRHEFLDVAGGTEIRDLVTYELPLGPLGGIAHRLFVRRQLEAIFDFRRTRTSEILGRPPDIRASLDT